MRTMWKGAISFGLVNVPIKLYTASESNDLKFNYLHAKCHTPIKYEKRCPTCDEIVAAEDIVRGFEYEKGKYVIMTEEDLAGIAIEQTRSIEIIDFVALSEIDPIYYAKTYFITPNEGGQKAYALLKEAMDQTGKIGIAKVVIRSKQHLAAIRVYKNCLALETMFFPEEIRNPAVLPELNYDSKLNDNELQMAVNLVNSLAATFAPEKYTDDYRRALVEVIEAKIEGTEVTAPAQAPQTGKVIDLMEALRASIKLAQEEKNPAEEVESGEQTNRSQETPSPNARPSRPEPESTPRRRRVASS